MADAEGADCSLVPALLVADTVKVYERPFVNPSTVHGDRYNAQANSEVDTEVF
jgi:hypothetical protein